MNQANGLDERQSMWLLPSTPTQPIDKRVEVTFPNQVPCKGPYLDTPLPRSRTSFGGPVLRAHRPTSTEAHLITLTSPHLPPTPAVRGAQEARRRQRKEVGPVTWRSAHATCARRYHGVAYAE